MMIDVIIPAYNCSRTLSRALASLAAQTDKDFRVTVVDDCSTEDINPIIYRYRHELQDLCVIRKNENEGAGMARQTGIDKTGGEWVCFLDADDVFMPYTIEVFKLIIENNPDTNIIHSAFLQQGIEDGKHSYNKVQYGFTWLHGKLYRREFLEKYNIGFKPEFSHWADDSFFNAQCSELTALTMNDLPMYIWTDTAGSITRTDPEDGRKQILTLINAMIAAGEHTLQYKSEIGHLRNTIGNIDEVFRASSFPMSEDEKTAYGKLIEMYDKYGVKPPQKKKRLFRK